MKMLKKVKFILAFVSLSICLCLMSNTYSRYVAGATSNVDIAFAKWQILVSGQDVTNGATSTIEFTPIIDQNEYVANNVIAPSSTGYFDVDIDASNVEVSFYYSIELDIENENMPDIKISGYSIVPNGYIEGDPLDIINIENDIITNALNYDKETPDFKFEAFSIRIYFEWYEGEDDEMTDEDDTIIGNTAAIEETTFKMNAHISFEQII